MVDLYRNDIALEIPFKIRNQDKTVTDLTGCTIKFQMSLKGSTVLKVDATVTITDPTHGECKWVTVAADLDTAGDYDALLKVTCGARTTRYSLPLFRVLPDLPRV